MYSQDTIMPRQESHIQTEALKAVLGGFMWHDKLHMHCACHMQRAKAEGKSRDETKQALTETVGWVIYFVRN